MAGTFSELVPAAEVSFCCSWAWRRAETVEEGDFVDREWTVSSSPCRPSGEVEEEFLFHVLLTYWVFFFHEYGRHVGRVLRSSLKGRRRYLMKEKKNKDEPNQTSRTPPKTKPPSKPRRGPNQKTKPDPQGQGPFPHHTLVSPLC